MATDKFIPPKGKHSSKFDRPLIYGRATPPKEKKPSVEPVGEELDTSIRRDISTSLGMKSKYSVEVPNWSMIYAYIENLKNNQQQLSDVVFELNKLPYNHPKETAAVRIREYAQQIEESLDTIAGQIDEGKQEIVELKEQASGIQHLTELVQKYKEKVGERDQVITDLEGKVLQKESMLALGDATIAVLTDAVAQRDKDISEQKTKMDIIRTERDVLQAKLAELHQQKTEEIADFVSSAIDEAMSPSSSTDFESDY